MKMEWISCKERLPEKSGKYLVATPYGSTYLIPYSKVYGMWNVQDEDGRTENDMNEFIAYWMPLPKVPEVEA